MERVDQTLYTTTPASIPHVDFRSPYAGMIITLPQVNCQGTVQQHRNEENHQVLYTVLLMAHANRHASQDLKLLIKRSFIWDRRMHSMQFLGWVDFVPRWTIRKGKRWLGYVKGVIAENSGGKGMDENGDRVCLVTGLFSWGGCDWRILRSKWHFVDWGWVSQQRMAIEWGFSKVIQPFQLMVPAVLNQGLENSS